MMRCNPSRSASVDITALFRALLTAGESTARSRSFDSASNASAARSCVTASCGDKAGVRRENYFREGISVMRGEGSH